ncbi:MAG: glycosyltransferase family 4 protein [Chlamydiae bacterium]|nr:glycosyltransferase family 4 protein [Chlamydiota bacterium]MBI3277326.1 glycosyltransferase family 4 protein [Chlamydiota bacterium]
MDILIFNWKDLDHPEVGGAEVITFELARRLVRDGHHVTWFCQHVKNLPSESVVSGIKIVRRGGTLSTYFCGYRYYRSLHKKPDLVIDMLNTLFWQTPLYVRGNVFAYVNQLAQEVFFYELPKWIAAVAYFLERFQFLSYRRTPFLCYSRSTQGDLTQVGIPLKNVRVFPMGLDHERYQPGEKASFPLFLCVSRLVRMKRVDLCIHAMQELVRKHPQAKLCIMGYGYERKRLEKICHELSLNGNVYFHDQDVLFFEKNSRDQKVFLMQKAWALLMPSAKEGWGMTVTESAACGTPAIVSRVSGLIDSVVEGRTGIILSKNPTSKELCEAMSQIIEDVSFRETLSKNAIEWSQNFEWEKSYQNFKELIIQ